MAGWHGTKGMWVIHSWPWYWLVWPWWGSGWMRQNSDRGDFRLRRAVDISSYQMCVANFYKWLLDSPLNITDDSKQIKSLKIKSWCFKPSFASCHSPKADIIGCIFANDILFSAQRKTNNTNMIVSSLIFENPNVTLSILSNIFPA